MKLTLGLAVLTILTLPLLATGPQGTVPRGMAMEYPAHAQANGAAIGARLLTAKQVHSSFSTDLNSCCLVVEVALYPAKGKSMDVSLNDFALQAGNTDHAVKPSSARLLAAELQNQNQKAAQGTGVQVSPVMHVGYESGIDPITGQRVHGVDYGVGVGVGVGGADPSMPSASTSRDRDVMQLELGEKGLPQIDTSAPVAGYIYFRLSKDSKKASHYLEYTLNGKKLSLKLN
ncbi:MAG TPA: hypothetical protein VGY31_16560 [Terriglobia bacterium]|nr:hypothetical protein [Terriglobia bacterium]